MQDFKLLDKIKWLNEYINTYVFSCFSKNNLGLKIRIEEHLYMMIENTMKANINKGNIRNKYQKELLVNISMLDYYIGVLYSKKLIRKKRFLSCINALDSIRKMCYGWINNEKS